MSYILETHWFSGLIPISIECDRLGNAITASLSTLGQLFSIRGVADTSPSVDVGRSCDFLSPATLVHPCTSH